MPGLLTETFTAWLMKNGKTRNIHRSNRYNYSLIISIIITQMTTWRGIAITHPAISPDPAELHDTLFVFFASLTVLCANYMELLTSSHSAFSNTLFIQTSFKDPLLSVSLSCPLSPIPNAPWFSSEKFAYLLTYLLICYVRSRPITGCAVAAALL